MEAQYGKFLDMIRAVRINVPLIDVLAGMPNYGKFLKLLVSNKHKLQQISAAFLSDESFDMIQNKVPPKLGDPKSFLIPCTFSKAFSCNALADLGASINLMSYSLYAKLSLETFKPTKMSMNLWQDADENSESESDEEEPKFEKITTETDFKIKTSLDEPPSDLELKPLPDNLEYVFLEEPSFLPVIISSKISEQKKSKCMLAIFHDMIEESVEVFMDDFSVFGNSFDHCLNNLDKMLQRFQKIANLVLNWEKCHFKSVKKEFAWDTKSPEQALEV
ncbi:reverse transcriptase domain-containing protein [Tanacetum coccineum]|uniref:Reverse transcriptase domain-containing protein n=1 Tax=Tanacetum coccineum TaxID=301880 RepID=A0ABQ4ZTD1_9ASTR